MLDDDPLPLASKLSKPATFLDELYNANVNVIHKKGSTLICIIFPDEKICYIYQNYDLNIKYCLFEANVFTTVDCAVMFKVTRKMIKTFRPELEPVIPYINIIKSSNIYPYYPIRVCDLQSSVWDDSVIICKNFIKRLTPIKIKFKNFFKHRMNNKKA